MKFAASRLAVAAAVCTGTILASPATAQELPGGTINLLTQGQAMTWEAGMDGQFDWTDEGYSFNGSESGSGWVLQWDMLASGASAESIVTSFTVMNTSTTTETFFIQVTDLIYGDYGDGSLVGGSIAGSFTDLNGNGVAVSSIDGGSIYSGFVDGSDSGETVVGTLLEGSTGTASSFFSGTFEGESFGDFPQIPGGTGPAIETNFGIILAFELSAGDTAAFTASMAIATPTPGVLALFSVAGMNRRRRRTS